MRRLLVYLFLLMVIPASAQSLTAVLVFRGEQTFLNTYRLKNVRSPVLVRSIAIRQFERPTYQLEEGKGTLELVEACVSPSKKYLACWYQRNESPVQDYVRFYPLQRNHPIVTLQLASRTRFDHIQWGKNDILLYEERDYSNKPFRRRIKLFNPADRHEMVLREEPLPEIRVSVPVPGSYAARARHAEQIFNSLGVATPGQEQAYGHTYLGYYRPWEAGAVSLDGTYAVAENIAAYENAKQDPPPRVWVFLYRDRKYNSLEFPWSWEVRRLDFREDCFLAFVGKKGNLECRIWRMRPFKRSGVIQGAFMATD